MVLSIHEPNETGLSAPAAIPEGQRQFRAVKTQYREQANSLYLFLCAKQDRLLLDKNLAILHDPQQSQQIIICDNCLRCSINYHGNFEMSQCPSPLGNKINQYLTLYLAKIPAFTTHNSEITGQQKMDFLNKITDDLAEQLASQTDYYLAKFCAADYDISLKTLREHCVDGDSCLFASLNWQQITFSTG